VRVAVDLAGQDAIAVSEAAMVPPRKEIIPAEAETLDPDDDRARSDEGASSSEEVATSPAIPGCEVLAELGRGGMGVVYKARQIKLDRLVALKVLPHQTAAEPAFVERFSREARALAKLNHPNILTVHDFGQTDGQSYFIMEFVEGANLRQRLRDGPMPAQQALAIVAQICDALQYAHDEGIVHRDIKPENILLDKKERVKMADFGIAKLLLRRTADYTLTGPWQVMGTLKYMAPEQLENPLEVYHRADIYSLGVMFYEMLTGELPMGPFSLPSQKVALDPELDEVVLRALEKEPGRRYQQVSELRAALPSSIGPASPMIELRDTSVTESDRAGLGGAGSDSAPNPLGFCFW
jgi:serine/threonine protein kinase